MNIKGEYRDILSRNGDMLMDTGWKSNTIVADYGRFLAALMKKDFEGQAVGIEYMAVGGGSEGAAKFKGRVERFFDREPKPEDEWVWAKKIDADSMIYLDERDNDVSDPTNKLAITVEFGQNEPSGDTSKLKEFALLGIYEDSGTFNTEKMFFINYVSHGLITKYADAKLDRTIILPFPFEEVIS